MRDYLLLALLATFQAGVAHADVLVAVRPGVMCESAAALARLTRPDGSSRSALPSPDPRDLELKAAGGCVDIPLGARIAVRESYRNTSHGRYDPGDGRGPQDFVLPNIAFRPLPGTGDRFPGSGRVMAPPSEPDTPDFLFSALEQACPEKRWRGARPAALRRPLDAVLAEEPPGAEARCAGCAFEEAVPRLLQAAGLGRLLRAFCAAEPG